MFSGAKQRIIAALLVVAVLLPSAFIVAEAHHHCTGDGCEICSVLAIAVHLQQQPNISDAGISLIATQLMAFMVVFAVIKLALPAVTPVRLKVRKDE